MHISPGRAAHDPTDVAGRRAGAAVVDLGVIVVIEITLWLLLSHDFTRIDRAAGTIVQGREVSGPAAAFMVVVGLAYAVGVFVVQRGLTGRTLGTIALGLVTVGESGEPLGPGPAFVRSLAGIVDYVPCCLPIVGVVTVLTSPGHRRVGDMAARSYVVDEAWLGRPLGEPTPQGPALAVLPDVPGPTTPLLGPDVPTAPPPQPPTPPPARPPAAPTGSWGGPAPTPPPTAPPAAADPVMAPPRDRPWWDQARGAYLLWDEARQAWLQFDHHRGVWLGWDERAGCWRPVEDGGRR